MLTNSLFLDFLLKNGLKVWKEESTRDVICLEFGYGSRSYGEERKHLEALLSRASPEDGVRVERLKSLLISADENKDKFDVSFSLENERTPDKEIQLDKKEKEKFELLLISNPFVKPTGASIG